MNINSNTAGRIADTPAAYVKPHTNYLTKKPVKQGPFRREKLPYPIAVLKRLGIKPSKANNKGFWNIRCPLHKEGNETNPSLSLHQVNGYYRCHACGAKGGDILSFYIAVTGKSFPMAARELGAWEDKQ